MKNTFHMARILIAVSAALISACNSVAGVAVKWIAETSRVQPEIIDAWRGDTLDIVCTLRSYGQPVTLGAATASFMWQTNGMGNVWWQTNATVAAGGVVRAMWDPSMDPGAGEVAFFMPVMSADGASYRAAGRIRFRPSPGSGSQTIDIPQPGATLDFGAYRLVNAPWATLEAVNSAIDANNAMIDAAIMSATNAIVIPPPVDLGPYATTNMVSEAVQESGNDLSRRINAVSNAAMQRAEMVGYATKQEVTTAIAGIPVPSLAGYATQEWAANYFSTNYTPPDLSSYASRSYADAAASNAQATAIAAIPSLAGYATQNYAQNAAESAASTALSAAQSYARDLSWAASEGNTRLVSIDGTIWQDATGTVWQVFYVYGWGGTVINLSTSDTAPIAFHPTTGTPPAEYVSNLWWTAGGGTNIYIDVDADTFFIESPATGSSTYNADGDPPLSATNITFTTPQYYYSLYYRPVALATNPVDRVIYESGGDQSAVPGNYAAVSNAAMSAAAQTNDFLRLTGGFMQGPIVFPYFEDYGPRISVWHPGALSFDSTYPDCSNLHAVLDISRVPTDGNGFGTAEIAFLSDIPSPPDLTPYATKSALQSVSNIAEDVRTESEIVYRLYSGSNVVAEVTNYNSQVHAPSLRLMQLNESNEYVTVWTETNGLARTFRDATNYTDGAIAAYAAPRAWSRTTSGLGSDAPANTTWISTPRTVIAGGLEYAKIVDTYGEVWVLTSNGMAMDFNPDTNAYFRITADDGTPVFSIEKSDAQVLGAYAEGITVGANSVTMPVPVVSAEAPTMYWRNQLDSGDWSDQTTPPTGATVTWSGTAGSWVCTVTFSGTRPPLMFFKFSFIQEGGVVIRNNATTDLSSGIWVNGTKFVPTVSGNNLIWTKQ